MLLALAVTVSTVTLAGEVAHAGGTSVCDLFGQHQMKSAGSQYLYSEDAGSHTVREYRRYFKRCECGYETSYEGSVIRNKK